MSDTQRLSSGDWREERRRRQARKAKLKERRYKTRVVAKATEQGRI